MLAAMFSGQHTVMFLFYIMIILLCIINSNSGRHDEDKPRRKQRGEPIRVHISFGNVKRIDVMLNDHYICTLYRYLYIFVFFFCINYMLYSIMKDVMYSHKFEIDFTSINVF